MDKKGQGISMTYIIIALLALVVLVVIVLFFYGGMEMFTGRTKTVGETTEQQLSLWRSQCRLVCSLEQKEGFCKVFEVKDKDGNVINKYVCSDKPTDYGCTDEKDAKSLEIVCDDLKV